MKKVTMMMMVAALAIAVCVSGCKPKGGEAKKDAGKAATGAAATQEQAATSGAAAYGDEICKSIMNDPASMAGLMSSKFMTLNSLTSQQEKALPKEQVDKMLKGAEEGMKSGMKSDPKAEKPKDCKVVEAKDVACDEIYTKIDAEGTMGMKPAKGRAKEVGDSMKLEACGLITMTATTKGKAEPIEFGVAKADGKYTIFSMFQVKAAK